MTDLQSRGFGRWVGHNHHVDCAGVVQCDIHSHSCVSSTFQTHVCKHAAGDQGNVSLVSGLIG
jgi:hypothetical protein